MEHTPEVRIPLANASFHRQNALARALREIGCLERTLFILDWISDPALRRRSNVLEQIL
jgi:TnpA family transposase